MGPWSRGGAPGRGRGGAWGPDGARVASGGDNGSVFLLEVSDGTVRASLQGHRGMVMRVAWSPDGRLLASGGGGKGGGELFVWDVRSGERLHALGEPSEKVYALAWSPTGERRLSGGSDGMLRWWDLEHDACVRGREGDKGGGQSVKGSFEGRRLASCG